MNIILNFLKTFLQIFSAMAPWLLLGYFLAGVIAFFIRPDQIRKHLGGKGWLPVLKAVLIGVPLPVCSCGVIPIASALRKEGAEKSAAGAFYISTPQTGIDSIIVTASMIGWIPALIRPAVAFLSGMTGGLLIAGFVKSDAETPAPAEEKKGHCCCCQGKSQNDEKKWKNAPLFILSYGFVRMMKSTSPSLLTGMIAATVIQLLIPEDFGAGYLRGSTVLEFAAVLILAIPLYVCSSASVPVALALLLKGFSPGAALLFLIAGPSIHSVSIASMRQIIGGKAAFFAVLSVAFWSVAAGITANLLDLRLSLDRMPVETQGGSLLKTVCGVILALLVFRALVVRQLEKRNRQ